MGWWRQALSVTAQAALSLSLPGREGHEETEARVRYLKHTQKWAKHGSDGIHFYIHAGRITRRTIG